VKFRDFLLQEATDRVDERIGAFWSSVDKQGRVMPYMSTKCWEWKGGVLNREGFWIGKKLETPRYIAWRLERGTIPDGQQVLSLCENALCVRPEHLTLGLYSARIPEESDAPVSSRSHLTEPEVLEARKLLTAGRTADFIAKKFDVPREVISYIRVNQDWKGR